jgi:AAA domain
MPKPMVLPIMSAEKPSLSLALKTLWGAAEMPFSDACAEAYRHPHFEQLSHRLGQLCEIGASGLLHGPNGVGKSYLCGCLTEKLPEKRYKILWLAHSSLTGSDLIRSLCRQLGIQAQMRRSDNVAEIHSAFAQLGSRWPLLVAEEAQNLSASAATHGHPSVCCWSATTRCFRGCKWASTELCSHDSASPWRWLGSSRPNPGTTSPLGFAPWASTLILLRIKRSNYSSRPPVDCLEPLITSPNARSKPPLCPVTH